MASTPARDLKRAIGFSIVWGIALVLCGIISIVEPMVGGIAVAIVAAWLFLFGGVMHLAIAVQTRGAGPFLWQLLLGLLYLFCGGYLLLNPAIGVASLTLVLAAFFFVQGVFEIAAWSRMRAGWLLIDGIVMILVALLIWLQWPASSAWAIGTLVGIGLIFSGTARTMLSVQARRVASAVA